MRIAHSRERFVPYLMVAPVILLLAGVLGYPVLYGVWMSFFRIDLTYVGRPFVGFANYTELLQSERFQSSMSKTLLFVVSSVMVAMVLALVFSMVLYRAKRFANGFKTITLIPYLVSPVATATIFRFVFSADVGIVNMLLDRAGMTRILFLSNPDWALFVTIVANIWFNAPFAVLVLLSGLEGINPEYFDSAKVDGAGPIRTYLKITIPLIYPMIGVTFTWLTFVSFNMFAIILSLTGGGPRRGTEVLAVYMYNVAFRDLNFSLGATLMVVILVLNVAASIAFLNLFKERT